MPSSLDKADNSGDCRPSLSICSALVRYCGSSGHLCECVYYKPTSLSTVSWCQFKERHLSLVITNILPRASTLLCVWVHDVLLLCSSSTEPFCWLNEPPLQQSDWWVLKLSARCVLKLADWRGPSSENGRGERFRCGSECVCMCAHTEVEWAKCVSCGWKCTLYCNRW